MAVPAEAGEESQSQQPETLHTPGEDVIHLISPENRPMSPVTVSKRPTTAWINKSLGALSTSLS